LRARTHTATAHKLRADGGRRPHVVVVGAGFGGLAAASRLAREPVDVTVIDRRNHHLFQPLLYQVATAGLSAEEIAIPIRAVLRPYKRVTVLLDEVVDLDPGRRRVITRGGADTGYDYLVLAPGSHYSYFGHEADWPQMAPGLKSLDDAATIRRRLLLAFERAETTSDRGERERLMTFVLVGAGSTGVEMAGAIAELAKAALARDFRRINPRAAKIVLVEAGPHILPAFRPELRDYAAKALRRMGVEIRVDTPIELVDADGVVAKGERIAAATVVWCAGVAANPVGRWLKVDTARNGQVEVKPDLSVPRFPEIFVIGDSARVIGADGKPLPGLAPVAKQQGEYVAAEIAGRVRGRLPGGPFRYRDRGLLATIGRSSAVVDFGWIRLKGLPAWILWSTAHIFFLIGWRNRMAVFVDWMWSWMTYKRGARVLTEGDAFPQQGVQAPRESERRRSTS
jgi:NADH:ubiquinone reductase (H+-translocating)